MRGLRSLAILTLNGACAQLSGAADLTVNASQPTGAPEVFLDGDASSDAGNVEASTRPLPPPPPPPPNLCGDTSGVLAGVPWPLVYGCPTNAGRSPFKGPATGGTALAPFGTIGNKRGAVVGRNGVVFLEESGQGDVFAFDVATGQQKWLRPTGGSGFNPVTALDRDNVLYSSTNYGRFFSIDTATGEVRWDTQLAGVLSPPVISAPGVAFVGSNAYGFYAVDLVEKRQKWHFDVPNEGDTSTAPAVHDGIVYMIDSKNRILYGVDTSSGTKTFAEPLPGLPNGSPVVGVDAVYVATEHGIFALQLVTGKVKWQPERAAPAVQPALLAYGDLASSTPTGHAFVLDKTTGRELRSVELDALVDRAPIIDADDTVIYATAKGTTAITKAGSPAWHSQLAGPVVLAEGRVVVLQNQQTFGVIGP